MRVGDTVRVTLSDGTTAQGVVSEISDTGRMYSAGGFYLGFAKDDSKVELIRRRATQVGDMFVGGDVFDVPNGTLVSTQGKIVLVKNSQGLDSVVSSVRHFDEHSQLDGHVFTVVFISDPN